MKASYPTLEYVADQKLIKELAFCLLLKGLFKNSCIYKETLKTLPRLLNCSKTKVNRGIKVIIDQKWGYWHSQNLILKSGSEIHELYSDYKAKNFAKVNNKDEIHLALLKNKLKQKEYIKAVLSDLKSTTKRVVKSAYKKIGERKYVDDGTSLKIVSKVFGISISQTSRILKKLEYLGRVKIIKRRQLVGVFNPKIFLILKEKIKGLYISGGYMWYNLTSKISILSYNNIA